MANPYGLAGPENQAETLPQYIAQLLRGTLSVIDLPPRQVFEKATRGRHGGSLSSLQPLKPDAHRFRRSGPNDSPIPLKPGDPARSNIDFLHHQGETAPTTRSWATAGRQRGYEPLPVSRRKSRPTTMNWPSRFVFTPMVLMPMRKSAQTAMSGRWGRMRAILWKRPGRLSTATTNARSMRTPAEGVFPMATPHKRLSVDAPPKLAVTYASYGEFVANGKTRKTRPSHG